MSPIVKARMSAAVLFARDAHATAGFYERVFGCSRGVDDPGAILLTSAGGFQIYVVERGRRSRYATGNLGPHAVMWSVGADEIDELEKVLRAENAYLGEHESEGTRIVKGVDPDGAPFFCECRNPGVHTRSVVAGTVFN